MNVRIVIFVLVALTIIGVPAYWFIDEAVSGGIKNYDGYSVVNLKAMSTFELDQENGIQEDVPKKWRDLDGRKVVLVGEMWVQGTANSSTPQFDLVYSIAKCCFTGTAQVQHFVRAKLPVDKSVEVYNGQVRVTGTLHVKVEHEGGHVSRVYSVDVANVEPV